MEPDIDLHMYIIFIKYKYVNMMQVNAGSHTHYICHMSHISLGEKSTYPPVQ